MFEVSREIEFSYGHRLRDYSGKCRLAHGHNGRVIITLAAELNPLGMVVDFSEIDASLKSWIDQTLDHRMILREDDPLAEVLRAEGEPVVTLKDNPTAEVIAKLIFDYAASQGLPVQAVTLYETSKAWARYPGRPPGGNDAG